MILCNVWRVDDREIAGSAALAYCSTHSAAAACEACIHEHAPRARWQDGDLFHRLRCWKQARTCSFLFFCCCADLNSPADTTGQTQVGVHYYCLLQDPQCSCNAPLCCACCCAGSVLGSSGASPRRASKGERCDRRLSCCKGKLYVCPSAKCCQG